MEKTRIIRSGKEVELLKYVPDYYLIAERVNRILDQLRVGISTWVTSDRFNDMNVSIWIYDDIKVNAFCCFQNGYNYIALSVGLFFAYWDTIKEFVDKDNFNVVFKLSEANRPIVMEMLYFYMLNFTIAHEFAYIAHGHLKENSCNNYIDEIFELDEEEKSRNWATQLKEYDADNQDGDIPDDETEKEKEASDFDYDSLLAINSDCVGWIRIDGTDIDYPVVQAADNSIYLHHNFNQESAICGAIFMDYRNDIDLAREHLILYGHQMKGGSMFKQLNGYKDKDFYKEHPEITLYLRNQKYSYDVLAVYVTNIARSGGSGIHSSDSP